MKSKLYLLLSLPQELTDRGARGLEVDYELDLDLEEFEAFQLPKLSASRYLHDFGANMTGIVGRMQFIAVYSNLTYLFTCQTFQFMAKFGLDCARVEGVGAQSNPTHPGAIQGKEGIKFCSVA